MDIGRDRARVAVDETPVHLVGLPLLLAWSRFPFCFESFIYVPPRLGSHSALILVPHPPPPPSRCRLGTSRSVKWLKARKKGEQAYRLVDREGPFNQSIGESVNFSSVF